MQRRFAALCRGDLRSFDNHGEELTLDILEVLIITERN